MSTKTLFALGALATMIATAVGCSQPTGEATDDSPVAADDSAGATNTVYSYDAYGNLWSATANGTGATTTDNYASGTFTGPAGWTRKMGVCLLKKYAPAAPTVCNSVADCGAAPATLPTGGSRYCMAPQNTGTKYCYYRPGTQAAYCAGTPADPYHNPIPAGTYQSPSQSTGGGTYMSNACFEGCTATDPSASSDERAIKDLGTVKCGSVYC